MAGDAGESDAPPAFTLRRLRQYLWRATFLLCPVCGARPIFLPLSRVRSMHDWLTPLDGCPVDGYAYDREPGYFLMSVWAIGYAVSVVISVLIYAYLTIWHRDLSLTVTLLIVASPLPLVNLLFARHAKAYFLAIDHLFDPHLRHPDDGSDDDDGPGGDHRPPPPPVPAPRTLPEPAPATARREGVAAKF